MGSKAFLVFGLALAVLLVISSEVSARDLAEANKVGTLGFPADCGPRGSCCPPGFDNPTFPCPCCSSAADAAAQQTQPQPHN